MQRGCGCGGQHEAPADARASRSGSTSGHTPKQKLLKGVVSRPAGGMKEGLGQAPMSLLPMVRAERLPWSLRHKQDL